MIGPDVRSTKVLAEGKEVSVIAAVERVDGVARIPHIEQRGAVSMTGKVQPVFPKDFDRFGEFKFAPLPENGEVPAQVFEGMVIQPLRAAGAGLLVGVVAVRRHVGASDAQFEEHVDQPGDPRGKWS